MRSASVIDLEHIEGQRGRVALLALAAGLVTIVLLHVSLPSEAAHILLDRREPGYSGGKIYPFSVQNAMWLAFAMGLGELFVRFRTGGIERAQIGEGFLPEDRTTILQADDLPAIVRKVRAAKHAEDCFLPRLVARCAMQFQTSESVDQSASLLNTSSEMFLHEVDLRYGMLRYICWVIPSLGFIGTVIGIGLALEYAGDPKNVADPKLLSEITGRLAVSFNGTLVALLMASILVFLQHLAQSREEHALNAAGQYCLDNLINRLYVHAKGGP